ncbi:PepSY domain-containing protein [Microbispora hainanensis]|uniref:PepSY domain-containing protein n=1 Tax=Microbispora hainanensis TaxID=568844 RepID=A0A544YXI7_9ACTN|nr:PepSY domain-containing protein [Microbispora hainanensis]TQS21470.1 PepSY domain-containing protein [Microbispora hainanensis]
MRQTTKIALAAAVTVTALAAGGTAVAAAAPAPLSSAASASLSQASLSRASASTAAITWRQAVAIAKKRVPGARVTEVEREWEHGYRTWKIELHKGHTEYDVYVAIATGRIIKFRVDHDD